jgi:hypothetical protein
MKKFWVSVLSSNGKISSKRLITLGAFVIIAIGFIGNMIWKYTIDAGIFDSLTYVVLGGLGSTVAERFGKGPNSTPPADEETA